MLTLTHFASQLQCCENCVEDGFSHGARGCLSFSGLFLLLYFSNDRVFPFFLPPGLADRSLFLRVLVAFLHCVSGCCLAAVWLLFSCLAAVWQMFSCLAAVGVLFPVWLLACCCFAVWLLSASAHLEPNKTSTMKCAMGHACTEKNLRAARCVSSKSSSKKQQQKSSSKKQQKKAAAKKSSSNKKQQQ